MLAMIGITNDQIASAEEVSNAIEQQDKKIQSALTELNAVSHAGGIRNGFQEQSFPIDLKANNPMSYQTLWKDLLQLNQICKLEELSNDR